ncbi:hypothetical protein, partial [Kitasatospora sp. MBT63]|uniref:hypothetical protein n=1 Tax=Kitasatospora sp. MBT63 TaxID=1444768 RepID=UPI0018F60CE5
TTRTLDLAGRPVTTTGTFADRTLPTPAVATTAYDGLGRPAQATAGDIVTTPVYGHGGVETGSGMQPASAQYPGAPFSADRQLDVSGNSLHKDLTQGEGDQAETRGGTVNTYDQAGRIATQTDQ